MNFAELIQTVIAGLLVLAIAGLVKLYAAVNALSAKVEGQVNLLIERIDGHEELDNSRFVSLQEAISQVRLAIAALTNEKKKGR